MMNNTNQLQKFIRENDNWEAILTQPPYSLIVKRDRGFVLLKYNQIASDFSQSLVRGARGVIFDEDNNFEVVARPFEKFFNWGEELVADIDWSSAKIFEKIDGSILKCWWNEKVGEWNFSTNGVIFGRDVPVMFPDNNVKTFGDMISNVPEDYWEDSDFDKNFTYLFEVVGPQNRVVVPYEKINMYFLSAFNNKTGEERSFEDSILFPRPAQYIFTSLEETLEFSKREDFNVFKNEGFVVVDRFSNRLKIKTEDYLRIHRLRGDLVPNDKRILEMIFTRETEEFLSYFPDYQKKFDEMKFKIDSFQSVLSLQMLEMIKRKFESRKELAIWAKKQSDPNFLFQVYSGKINSIWDWIQEQRIENILKRISNL